MDSVKYNKAAKALKRQFLELSITIASAIHHVDVDDLKSLFSSANIGELHLARIIDSALENTTAILNYILQHSLVGWINYDLLKVFQLAINSNKLNEQIEMYENTYALFIKLSLEDIHAALRECPDLQKVYEVGIPDFIVVLVSEHGTSRYYKWKDLLQSQFEYPKGTQPTGVLSMHNSVKWHAMQLLLQL